MGQMIYCEKCGQFGIEVIGDKELPCDKCGHELEPKTEVGE